MEMTLFSNDTERDIFTDGLEAVRESEVGKGQGTLFPGIVRSSIVTDNTASSPHKGEKLLIENPR